MKFRITFKDPDGVSNCVQEAVEESVKEVSDPDEKEAIIEIRTEKVYDSLNKWLRYQEYVTIEFDTDAGTAVVCGSKQ